MEKLINTDIKVLFSTPDKKRGVEKYAEIMRMFSGVNVKIKQEFQKKFNAFYRVRRNKDWQQAYYGIMEESKEKNTLTFEKVLREIYIKTGRVEASFASKLLHTINPNMPIWDKFVLQNLNLKMPICNGEMKIVNAVIIYNNIIEWYNKALSITEIYQKTIDFDEVFCEFKWFSATKKLDFLLWQMR